jgi:CheY-like chemotaxis protein
MGRIAIIDDAPDILELLEVILTGSHDIATFSDPEVFLKEFNQGRFDVIVLDIVMPEMSGYELLNSIRKRDPQVPVVATTAKAAKAERENALAAGFSEHFAKPLDDLDVFRNTVYHLCRRRSTSL